MGLSVTGQWRLRGKEGARMLLWSPVFSFPKFQVLCSGSLRTVRPSRGTLWWINTCTPKPVKEWVLGGKAQGLAWGTEEYKKRRKFEAVLEGCWDWVCSSVAAPETPRELGFLPRSWGGRGWA